MEAVYTRYQKGLISKEDFILSLTLQYPDIKVLDFINMYTGYGTLSELISDGMSKTEVLKALRMLLDLD
ncbi:MAG: hypothetical protein ACRCU6_06055 [Fusobacteriaceae bacterium]